MGAYRERQIRTTGLGLAAMSLLAVLAVIAIILVVGGHLRTVLHDSSLSDAPGASLVGQR